MLRVYCSVFGMAAFLVLGLFEQATAQVGLAAHADARDDANRELEMRELRLKLFVQSEYPLERRRLTSAITLADAEAAVHEREAMAFEKLHEYSVDKSFRVTVDNARFAALGARTREADLKEEKRILEGNYLARRRLLELEVEAARAQLRKQGVRVRIDQPRPPASISPPRYVRREATVRN